MWLGLLYLINSRIDLLMLGTLKGAHAAGVYAVALRAAELAGIFLIAAGGVLAPRIAQLHAVGDIQGLQRLVTRASKWIAALTLPFATAMVVGAKPLLSILFGDAYTQGADALRILAIGQAFNVAAGPTGMLLNMTGNERLSSLGVGIGMLINLALSIWLIPLYDATGAAIATTTSIVVWNLLLLYWVRTRLKIRAGILGI